jgi:hypothetical protein
MQRNIKVAPVRKTVVVKAEPEKAFRVFTSCRWWMKELFLPRALLKRR